MSNSKTNIGSKNRSRTLFLSKLITVVVLLMLQILLLGFLYLVMNEYMIYWQLGALLISVIVIFYVLNKQENPAYKLVWVLLISFLPVTGGILYLVLAGNGTRRRFIRKANENNMEGIGYLPDDTTIRQDIEDISVSASVQARYISKTAGFPVYKNTSVRYFELGEENYKVLKEELSSAKHFIFMEYFIIRQGQMWDTILGILKEKAKEGVEIRLLYDDFGCAMSFPSRFNEEMRQYGIKVAAFNKVLPVLSLIHNNRDHRKITVIDGHTGFTGGINLADEYINKQNRFGHWKDTGVMLKGDAVWNLTVMFLQNWKLETGEAWDYRNYIPERYAEGKIEARGFVQPYGDTPVDKEIVGENIYLNMICKAKKYVYITTPYLIVDNEMVTALTLAAKSGIDVRIITPGIPDKKAVFMVTQSYYNELVRAGVRIYQYTPGFIHAKTVVVDDRIATVGTINFDYRSLYLHFECGVWMFDTDTIYDIRDDFMDTLRSCEEITTEKLAKTSGGKRLAQSILKLFAPLM